MSINHCRFCRADNYKTTLVRYGIRHNACVPCAIARLDDKQLAKIPLCDIHREREMTAHIVKRLGIDHFKPKDINNLPWFAFKDAGVEEQALERLKAAGLA